MQKILVTGIFLFCFSGCAAAKKITRTVNDTALILCELIAAEQPSDNLDGLSPKEWCAIHENLHPFIDHVLQAKQEDIGFATAE